MSGQPHPMRSLVGVQKARNAGRASNLIQTQYRQERFSVYPIVTVIEQLNRFAVSKPTACGTVKPDLSETDSAGVTKPVFRGLLKHLSTGSFSGSEAGG